MSKFVQPSKPKFLNIRVTEEVHNKFTKLVILECSTSSKMLNLFLDTYIDKTAKSSELLAEFEGVVLDKIDALAKSKNVRISKIINELIDKYLNLDEEVIPVVLKIPKSLKNNKEDLSQW